jgi:hypothetical protein
MVSYIRKLAYNTVVCRRIVEHGANANKSSQIDNFSRNQFGVCVFHFDFLLFPRTFFFDCIDFLLKQAIWFHFGQSGQYDILLTSRRLSSSESEPSSDFTSSTLADLFCPA